jgi:ketosteroid isomerase-like protein
MAEHANHELFMRAFAAFGAADMDTLAEVFDEQVVWHSPGANPLSGEHRGQQATFAMFGNEFRLSNGSIRPELQHLVSSDETVVALLRTSAQRDERKALDQDVVLTFHVRGGKLAEGWTVWTDQDAADTFWS